MFFVKESSQVHLCARCFAHSFAKAISERGLIFFLMRGPPTVNHLCTAGYATGSIGAEIGDQVRDLLRLQQAVNRCFSHHDLLHYLGLRDTMNPGLISNLLFDKRGSYIGWAN